MRARSTNTPRFSIAPRARLRDRVAARWRSGRLDRALATGTPPEATAALAVRARRITRLDRRRALARALRGIVHEARTGTPPSSVRITPCRGRVAAAGEELIQLTERLAQPGPVAPRGVAQARLLLTDGRGPLYNRGSSTSLRARVLGAAEMLAVEES